MQDERARKYAQEVQSLQFNILVTTYEFIMRDRSRLSKVGGAEERAQLHVVQGAGTCSASSQCSASPVLLPPPAHAHMYRPTCTAPPVPQVELAVHCD